MKRAVGVKTLDQVEPTLIFDAAGHLIPTWASLFQQGATESGLVTGDCNAVLSKFPDEVFRTCVTSPPYWSVRDYHIEGQIGLGDQLDEYLESLVAAFAHVWRVLTDDGTLWLNIGDVYTSGGRTWRAPDKKNSGRAMDTRPATPIGLKEKDLIGIPWRLALKLQEAGSYLRFDVIWYKPNCQPESVKDRPTKSHEYLFLFSKNSHYYYDSEAERGPNDRNLRTVWEINTSPFPEAHFATFPPALVERCLALTSQPTDLILDPFVGSGTTAEVAMRLGRRFVGVDLNPEYMNLVVSRLAGLNGVDSIAGL